MAVSPSDFRLTFADSEFRWVGERRPGLPILCWPDGTLCEPAITFFGYSAERGRVRISSMKPQAYAIREWLAFLASKGKRWDEVDDLLLRRWRDSQRDAMEAREISARQVERKLHTVFTFYRLLPEALPFDERGKPRRLLVGRSNPREGVYFPVTSKTGLGPKGERREMWSGAERVGEKRTKRPTPDESQVDKILTWLRAKPDRQISHRTGGDAQRWSVLEADRNWLVGRCMMDGGLRAHEVANLTIDSLAKALRTEGTPIAQGTPSVTRGGRHSLDTLSGSSEARETLLAALDALEARHRRSLYLEITGKGDKTRMAPFAIDLVRDLLEVGVWTVRHEQIAAWAGRDRKFRSPAQVFLSFKTKRAMTPGAVADLMKDAFNAVGVSGSGQRLRAHYATLMAARLWEEAFALNGFRFDQTVVNLAQERLAEAMGHARVDTTIKHYVEMAVLRHFGVANRTKLEALRGFWDAIVKLQGAVSEEKMRLMLQVMEALAATPDGSKLHQVLAMAVDDPELNPVAATPVPKRQAGKRPPLRVLESTMEHS